MKKVYLITESPWATEARLEYGVFVSKESALAKAKELAEAKARNWETSSYRKKEPAKVVQKGDEFWIYHAECSNLYAVVSTTLYE